MSLCQYGQVPVASDAYHQSITDHVELCQAVLHAMLCFVPGMEHVASPVQVPHSLLRLAALCVGLVAVPAV